MVRKLLALLTISCLAGMMGYSASAEIDPETIVAVWLCDEGAGKTLTDSSGNGHDGDFVGKVNWTNDGKFENALEFEGAPGSRVEIPHDKSLNLEEWTITAWVKVQPTGAWSIVLVKDPANGLQNYSLDMNDGGRVFSEITNAGNWSDCGSVTTVQDDEWHFLAASYDGKNLHVYVEGKQEKEQAFAPGDVNNAPVSIGDRMDSTQPLKGIIDDVGLFSVALSEDDLETIMNDGLSPMLSVEPGLKLATTWGRIKTY